MDRDAKIWKFARSLIAKHGRTAFTIARQRAQDRLDTGDYRAASGWARMADILKRMTITGVRRPGKPMTGPSLEEVLSGEVTEAVMKADKVGQRNSTRR